MKKIIFLSLIFIVFAQAKANESEARIESSMSNDSIPKISYNFSMEIGTYFGSTVGLSAVAVNSISFKNRDLLGLGLGYEMDIETLNTIPIFLNYRHYFPQKKNLQPFVNIAVGTRLCFNNVNYAVEVVDPIYGTMTYYVDDIEVLPGLYSVVAAGFRVNAFTFSSGFFFRTTPSFTGGVEVKVGFTFQ